MIGDFDHVEYSFPAICRIATDLMGWSLVEGRDEKGNIVTPTSEPAYLIVRKVGLSKVFDCEPFIRRIENGKTSAFHPDYVFEHALEVAERLRQLGHSITLSQVPDKALLWECSIWLHGGFGGEFTNVSTLPAAICGAALHYLDARTADDSSVKG